MPPLSIMLVAGDPSGDQHTAPVIRQLKKEVPECRCFGIGGSHMQTEGFEALLPFDEFNRMGYIEILSHISFFLNAKKLLVSKMKTDRPDLLICIDYSGFNTPIMKEAHALGIPVLWYIAPKFWAWKKKKHTSNLKNYATHVATIFPFETDQLKPYMKAVSFVGNPLVENLEKQDCHVNNKNNNLLTYNNISLALVPGSRPHEIQKILPVMVESFKKLKETYPKITAKLSRCPHIKPEMYKQIIGKESIEYFDGTLEELYSNTDIAIVTSGTATLQTALMGIPMVIVYKTSFLTYILYKTLAADMNIGLPNIIAGEEIVPELIQNEMTPKLIAKKLETYIKTPKIFSSTRNRLSTLRSQLGEKKPSLELVALIKKLSGFKEE